MVPEFDRSSRALAGDRDSSRLGLLLLLLLLGLWGAWLILGELTLYESSSSARVSAEGVARLTAPVGAVVLEAPRKLGERVQQEDLLLQLDDREQRLLLAAAQARVEGLSAQLQAVDSALEAEAAGRAAGQDAEAGALGAAQASLEEAQVRSQAARQELARVRGLVAAGVVSITEQEDAEAELAALLAREQALAEELARARGLRQQRSLEGEASASRAVEARSALLSELAEARAAQTQLEQALSDRAVRAPVAGLIGELSPLVPGQRVEAGALLVVLVPEGPALVEARFLPERAVGRVLAGQVARVRIAGAAGGSLGARPATVQRVGSEPGVDGLVAVQLHFDSPSPELRHGLIAAVEVEVERLSPLDLLVRAAGQAR